MLGGLLFATSLNAQDDLWIAKADLGDGSSSLKRSGAVSFTINGKVYIALGKDGTNYHQDVWEFDTIAETWTQKADFTGVGRIGAFAMVMNNKAIIGTGEVAGGGRTSSAYKFEPVGNTWTGITDFAGGERSFASAFSMGTRGFVVGGNDGSFQNDLWEYNINLDSWIGKQPFPGIARIKSVAFTIGTIAYYGTGDIGADTPSKDFWEYNIIANNWTQLADFPGVPRMGAVSAASGTNGYIGFGNDGTFLVDFWKFNAGVWTQQTDFVGNGRELAVATSAGNKVYVGTGFGTGYFKDFYQWDPCAVPQISVPPVGLDVCEGFDVSFSVTIDNPGGETYQWQNNGVNVPGANASVLDLFGVTETEEGSYTCEVTNVCGTSVSEAAILNVTPLPVNMPTGLFANPDTLCPGNTFDITLTADDNGDDQDTLRWYSTACGGDLEGVGYPVNPDLIVGAPDPLITTQYFARWENQCGASDCDTVTIYVKEVAVEPTSVTRSMDTICHDYNDELMLIAEGGSGDSLKWYLGDICNNSTAPYLGSGDTLDLFDLGIIPTVSSTYSVRWETYCSGDEFNSTCLIIDIAVNGEISISQQPQNIIACEGTDPVKFGIGIDEGASLTNINYQWYFEGAAISGATIDTLTLSGGIMPTDSGYYHCKVYNSCDTLYSDSAKLTVNLNPSIILQPSIFDTICQNDSVTFIVEATGTPVLQYQWYFNNSPAASIDTFLTINPTTFSNTGDYFCEISNGCSTVYTDTISMEVDTIPFFIEQPIDQLVCLNGTAEFLVEADGTIPMEYQWYKIDNTGTSSLITGETGLNLTISPVLEADTAFDYYCMVSNECSEGPSSDTAQLLLRPQVQIMDSIQSDTNYICYTYPTYVHLAVYGGEGDSLRWFTDSCDGTEIAITTDTILTITVPDTTTTYYAKWESPCGISSCDSVTLFVSQDPIAIDSLLFADNDICYNEYDSILLTAYGGSGDSIYWFEGFDCSGEPFAVTADTFVYVTDIQINDTPYAAHWGNACGSSACTDVGLYINDITIITEQTNMLEICENTNAQMYVNAEGTDPLLYQWFFNGLELAGMINDTLNVGPVTFADTGMYYCEVRSECDTAVSDSIQLVMLELPYFTMQPYDVSACEGGRDTVQIKVAGDYPILIQWYEDGVAIGGSSLLDTLFIVDPAINTAQYFAELSNGCGNIFSDTATFRVFDTIIITEQPQYQNLCLLDTARFNITAEVTEYVEYEWYKLGDGSIGTGASIIIPNLDYTDEGSYYCIISDTCGELSSDTVALNMNEPPQVITDPFGATVCEGTLFQFEVIATGDSINYMWYHDDVIVPDEVESTLIFNPVVRGDEGEYYVGLENNCGADASIPVQFYVDYRPDALDSLVAFPDTICPTCDYDYITLTAYGDGGGYGDYIEWYKDSVHVDYIIDTGRVIYVELPTQTTMYYAYWVSDCAPSGSGLIGGSGSGGGGGTGTGLGVQVYYQENPTVPTDINVDVNDFCITYGDSITLSADGGYGDRMEWNIIENGMETFIGYGMTIKVEQPLDTTLYAASWLNMCGKSDSAVIQVNVVPLAEVSLKNYDTICAGQAYQIDTLTTFVEYFESVHWLTTSFSGEFANPDTLITTYTDPAIPLFTNTNTDLILYTTALSPCEGRQDTIHLTTLAIPEITYTPELSAVCRDSSITLNAYGADYFIWHPMAEGLYDTDENPLTLTPQESTDYYLIGRNNDNCMDSVQFTIDVYATPMVDLGDSIFLYSCEPVQLDAGGGDGSEYYIWNNGNRTRSINVYETGTYSVIVGNPGCEVNDTGYISLCNGKLFMPNAFSPNEDGINEVLKPITSDPTIEFHMMIFDRWGKLLFETHDIHEGWDGNADGEPCPTGNYVYRLEFQGQGSQSPGKKASEVGTVMLVR